VAVTKSDSTVLELTNGLYIGTAGDLVVTIGGQEITFADAPAGYHPLHVTQVKAATAAADIVALY
jgi:hypothetical protein